MHAFPPFRPVSEQAASAGVAAREASATTRVAEAGLKAERGAKVARTEGTVADVGKAAGDAKTATSGATKIQRMADVMQILSSGAVAATMFSGGDAATSDFGGGGVDVANDSKTGTTDPNETTDTGVATTGGAVNEQPTSTTTGQAPEPTHWMLLTGLVSLGLVVVLVLLAWWYNGTNRRMKR